MPINPTTVNFHVTVGPDGTPECTPLVARVKPGMKIRWTGRQHSGQFVGIVPGPVKSAFTHAELKAIVPQKGPLPFKPTSWHIISEKSGAVNPDTVEVLAPAVRGQVTMYKFDVHAGGKVVDPIIIVDDTEQTGE